jgi:hypothetical protein
MGVDGVAHPDDRRELLRRRTNSSAESLLEAYLADAKAGGKVANLERTAGRSDRAYRCRHDGIRSAF